MSEEDAAACNQCADGGRMALGADHEALLGTAKQDPAYETAQWNCFCVIDQVEGSDRAACQSDASRSPLSSETGEPVDGWCYVDATTTPSTGNPDIVANCPETERRLVRFVGDAGKSGSTLFIQCNASASDATCR